MEIQIAVAASQVDLPMHDWGAELEGPSLNPVVHVIDDDDSFRRSMLRILMRRDMPPWDTAAQANSYSRSAAKTLRDAFC